MKTHYSLYENILNDSRNEVMTSQLIMTNVHNGFKTYKKLLPNLTTRVCWLATKSAMPVSPLELRSRK
jgi:hypothetical protein